MWPTCRDGDVLLVKQNEAPRVGDVVVVRRGSQCIAHRVRALDASGVWCAGDAKLGLDPVVPAIAVVGKVMAIQRRGGLIDVPRTSTLVRRVARLRGRLRALLKARVSRWSEPRAWA
jgi:hypothetical protein